MTNPPSSSEPPPDLRPAGNQFSLRGLFILITALSVILALLALAIREPIQWLGTLAVIAFCLAAIAVVEAFRSFFPPQPRQPYYLAPRPANPLQTMDFSEGTNPFADSTSGGESPFGSQSSTTDD